MKSSQLFALVLLEAVSAATLQSRQQKFGDSFNPLQWQGGDSPWFPAPDVSGISSTVPQGCEVDQVAMV